MLGTGSSESGTTAGPFSFSGCQPRPESCRGDRSPVRVSKAVVRPGRKNGGTTLVFTLSRRTPIRFTIVRVYPSCERVGTFRVRAHAGVNRIRFRSRFRGRPLAEGTYRLLVHARARDTAVTIVVARGQLTPAELRRARSANACSVAEAREIEAAVGIGVGGSSDPAATGKAKRVSVIAQVVGAAKGVTTKAQALSSRIVRAVEDEPFSDPFVRVILGLLTLSSAVLGALVLFRLSRAHLLR